HKERAVLRTHRDEALAVAQRELGDGDTPGLRQGLVQKCIWLLGGLLGFEVVRRLEIQSAGGVVILDEPGDVDGLARTKRELLEILVRELDVLALLVLIATHHVAPRDLVVTLDAKALVLDAALMRRAEEVEGNLARALRGQIQPDRDGDHPEAHDAFPNRSRHVQSPRWPHSPLARGLPRE